MTTQRRAPMARPWTTVRRDRRRARAIDAVRFALSVAVIFAAGAALVYAFLIYGATGPSVPPLW